MIHADHPDLGALRFYVAGPTEAVQQTLSGLSELGVARDRIATEETAS